MKSAEFHGKAASAIALACLKSCWVFPILIVIGMAIDSPHDLPEAGILILVVGSFLALIISLMYSLLTLTGILHLSRSYFFTHSKGQLVALLLPVHFLSIVVPLEFIMVNSDNSLLDLNALPIAAAFIFHAECVLVLTVRRLRSTLLQQSTATSPEIQAQ